jgi:beta-glucosidase
MPFNEPWIFTIGGYLFGMCAPGRHEPLEALRATHTANLAQGMAIRAIREAKHKPAMVGIANSMSPIHPRSDSPEDRAAAERWHRFYNLWFIDPVMRGTYPAAYLAGDISGLQGIRPGDMETINAKFDFIGINLYQRVVIASEPQEPNLGAILAPPQGVETTDFGWEVYPKALSEMILRMTKDFPGVPLYVTENGCSYGDGPGADGKVDDQRRISFLRRYIAEMGRAMAAGADVRGYFHWTFTDNFEWAEGTRQRFGIVYCDFKNQRRIVKESGRWYSRVARTNALDFDPAA